MSNKVFNKTILVIDVGNTNTVFAIVNNKGIYNEKLEKLFADLFLLVLHPVLVHTI